MNDAPFNVAWNVVSRMSAADPAELFRKLASHAAKLEPLRKLDLTSSAILDMIWERENQSPTTLGAAGFRKLLLFSFPADLPVLVLYGLVGLIISALLHEFLQFFHALLGGFHSLPD